jgi:hypothetical protein
VALGDVDGDGTPDLITVPGPGTAPELKVFSGTTGALLYDFYAFAPSFTGGLFVTAGDLNHDGTADIIVGADAGTNPEVRAFGGGALHGQLIRDFYAFAMSYSGGVRVAAGDVNGDGITDIITGTARGASQVRVFSGPTGALLADFYAFAPAEDGVFVGVGDVNGDGHADVITGAGNGAPEVAVFDGATMTRFRDFYAFPLAGSQGGVRVGAVDPTGDGRADLLLAQGAGHGPEVRVVDALSLAVVDDFFVYNTGFLGGISPATGA